MLYLNKIKQAKTKEKFPIWEILLNLVILKFVGFLKISKYEKKKTKIEIKININVAWIRLAEDMNR